MTAKQLMQLQRSYQRALDKVEETRHERDAAILEMIDAGHSHAQIYQMLDGAITRARIGQLANRTETAA